MADYFTRRQPSSGTPRITRPPPQVLQETAAANRTPGSPRTPLLGRSLSSQFGLSPGSFRAEQEEHIVYSLGARHFSAGFANEALPRCTLAFGPEQSRRVGDYRRFAPGFEGTRRIKGRGKDWGEEHSLYNTDLRTVDLGLVEARFSRALRMAHSEHLLLSESKPRKAVLAISSLVPNPLLEIFLKVLFQHQAQPPTVVLLPNPILTCVSAGVRSGLIVDVGWEETVITGVYEYRSVQSVRSIRAGKLLSEHMAKIIDEEVVKEPLLSGAGNEREDLSFEEAEEILERMGWCRDQVSKPSSEDIDNDSAINIPLRKASPPVNLRVPFSRLSEPAESALFNTSTSPDKPDDNELPIHVLAYKAFLSLPLDVRAVCMSRIILTGGVSHIPGLQHRFLQEVQHLVSTHRWDPVQSYGSMTAKHNEVLVQQNTRLNKFSAASHKPPDLPEPSTKTAERPVVPAAFAPHDDLTDPIGLKAEREHANGRALVNTANGEVRGVTSLGTWAGASLVAGMKLKGLVEVEREDFLKHGWRDAGRIF